MGADLIGAIGVDDANQDKINVTVARLCKTDVYTDAQCAAHGAAVQ